MFKVQIGVAITGKDKAFQGTIEVDLPISPFPSLELESLCSSESLIVDVVAWDVLAQQFELWCLPIQNSEVKARTLMKRFAGNWDWVETDMPECDIEPEQDAQQATDEANDYIRRLIQKRAGELPTNPRDAEKN